jgi:hypothetical protein
VGDRSRARFRHLGLRAQRVCTRPRITPVVKTVRRQPNQRSVFNGTGARGLEGTPVGRALEGHLLRKMQLPEQLETVGAPPLEWALEVEMSFPGIIRQL